MRRVAITATVLVGLMLTGCDDGESNPDRDLRLGKECFAAGGEWVEKSSKSLGEYCRFLQPTEGT